MCCLSLLRSCVCMCVWSQVDRNELQSRTYDYSGEEQCDLNADISLKAIEAAKATHGCAAVKVRHALCCCCASVCV